MDTMMTIYTNYLEVTLYLLDDLVSSGSPSISSPIT